MYQSGGTIDIPLRDTDEVIEIDVLQLPDNEEMICILRQENAPINTWFAVAVRNNTGCDSPCVTYLL